MQTQILVVSDPPHPDPDVEAVSAILRLDVDDVRLKLNFSAPEILSASDPTEAHDLATILGEAGLNVVVLDARELARVPWPAPARSLRFGDAGLEVQLRDGEVVVPWDAPVLGVFCKPPSGFLMEAPSSASGSGSDDLGDGLAIAEALQWTPTFDLYWMAEGAMKRATIAAPITDFAHVGPGGQSAPAASMALTVAECGRRFTAFELDRRLVDVRPRHRFVMGEQGFDLDMRKLYSFGTLLLRQVLDSASSDLRDLTHYEYASRLACALWRMRDLRN